MTWQLTKKHNFDAVFDSQKLFRLLLEAISNPTRIVDIKEIADKLFGSYPELLAVAMTLLDNETGFSIYGSDSLSADIAALTLARREAVSAADFIFVCDKSGIQEAIEKAKYGTLAQPHKSATVVIQSDGAQAGSLTLSGPGIAGAVEIPVSQAVKDALACRAAQNYEYPQGIDLIFVSDKGELMAVPRLVKVVE
ncbi:MAG TPA: phosphonate C-P lyase system protein PhnH [Clostridiales bacterium]|jgi:alpha-D-ribose 1-methylphosphonate 5-triphosphate synthase subunit PhnH|nr:phosphonate C-P lyase system protein PhnH [Clostridiales bacterium]